MADFSALHDLEETLRVLLAESSIEAVRRGVISRLVSSPEVARIRSRWASGAEGTQPSDGDVPGGVDADRAFVQLAYECILRRHPDRDGLEHYGRALAAGESHTNLVRALIASDEFTALDRDVPRDVQLCELTNPAKWDNPEWLEPLGAMGLSEDKVSMHRKPYEFAQLIFGCRRLGALREDATVVSIGAGHEEVLYWLANHVRHVLATDLYDGPWQGTRSREGDPEVIRRPETYAPVPFRRNHLTFMRMDGRRLAFRDGTFDIAYSLSSIEHFGGLEGASASVREMARVLKSGGLLALATEYLLEGGPYEEAFTSQEIQRLIDQPGLELVEPIDENVFRRYSCTPVDLLTDPLRFPHIVVKDGASVFTSVMVFLWKH